MASVAQPSFDQLERALRPIAMDRETWLACWTEIGAGHVGQIRRAITKCVLPRVDPCVCLVGAPQRIAMHRGHGWRSSLPGVSTKRFSDDPMESAIDPRAG